MPLSCSRETNEPFRTPKHLNYRKCKQCQTVWPTVWKYNECKDGLEQNMFEGIILFQNVFVWRRMFGSIEAYITESWSLRPLKNTKNVRNYFGEPFSGFHIILYINMKYKMTYKYQDLRIPTYRFQKWSHSKSIGCEFKHLFVFVRFPFGGWCLDKKITSDL